MFRRLVGALIGAAAAFHPSMRDCFVFALLATWQLSFQCSQNDPTWDPAEFQGPA